MAESGDQAFEVVLEQSGRSLTVAADTTILDALLAAGCDPMFDCKRGECGVCAVPVIEGRLCRLLLAVGNKAAPFREWEIETLRLIGQDIWRIVNQRKLIGPATRDMTIQRVVAGVDHAAREPAAVQSHGWIEHLLRRFNPVDLARRVSPEALRIAQRTRVNFGIAAIGNRSHGRRLPVIRGGRTEPVIKIDLGQVIRPGMPGTSPA